METKRVVYSIAQDSSEVHKSFGYYFPEFLPSDSVLTVAYIPFASAGAGSAMSNDSLHGDLFRDVFFSWEKNFRKPFIDDSLTLYQRVYCKGLKSYSVAFHSMTDDHWYSFNFNVRFDGYQIPVWTGFDSWRRRSTKKDSSSSTFIYLPYSARIDKMRIAFNPSSKVSASGPELVFGQLCIEKVGNVDHVVHHPFSMGSSRSMV